MNEDIFKKAASVFFFSALIILTFLILKPIFIAIIIALILAFIFSPLYNFFNRHLRSENISAGLIVVFLLAMIVLPIWFLTPILLDQSFALFQGVQQIDFIKPLKGIFPDLFASEKFSAEVGSVLSSFASRTANELSNSFAKVILNFPLIALQIAVVLFTFFFALRDKELLMEYIGSLLPFSKDVERKLFEQSRTVTSAILYGQVIVGILQGLTIGIGFFIFGVSNALVLTLLAALAGILPVLGTPLVWLPVAIYLFIAGNTVSGWGVTIFGLFASTFDNFLRPIIVSRRTKIHTGVLFVSMIGGLLFFGILGFILGPLVISYLLILLEIYRGKPTPGILIKSTSS